jgi:TolA-binding protein
MAWTYLGDVDFGLNDLSRAKTAYDKSISAYPNGRMADRARFGLARVLSELGERDQALRLLEKLAKRTGTEWADRAWLQIGLIRQSAGEFSEAAEVLRAVENAAPQSGVRSEARFVRAKCLLNLGRAREAQSLLRPLATESDDRFAPRAALELATLDLADNRPDAALAALDAALSRFPKSPEAPALLFRSAEALQKQSRLAEAQARFLKLAESESKDQWADDALKRAVQLALEQGDAATTSRLAARFATVYSESPLLSEVRLFEARAASIQGKPAEAVGILEPLLATKQSVVDSKKPSQASSISQAVRYELAIAYRALGRNADAEAALSKLATEGQSAFSTDAQFMLGQAHIEAGRFAAAIRPLEKYLENNPKGQVAEFALAHLVVAFVGTDRLPDAWKTLATFAQRFPQSKLLPASRLRLAEASLRAGDSQRALELFRLVAGNEEPSGMPQGGAIAGRDQAPDISIKIRALAGLGAAQQKLGKRVEAAAAFARILDLAPKDPIASQVALERARSLEAAQQSDDALLAYGQVIERYSGTDHAMSAILARAELLAKRGRNKEAAVEFKRFFASLKGGGILTSMGLTEDSVLAEWGWAVIDAHAPEEADRIFAKLLENHPQSPYAADARFNLAESANQARDFKKVVNLLSPLIASGPAHPNGTAAARPPHDDAKSAGSEPSPLASNRSLMPAVFYRLGRTQIELKDWKSAWTTFDRLLREFPNNPYRREAEFLRAIAAFHQENFSEALAGFGALLKESPAESDPKGFIASVRLKQLECWVGLNRWKEVLEATAALKADLAAGDPAAAEVDFARARALLGSGQLEAARTAFQAVIRACKDKDDDLAARAQLMCGESYFHDDQFHEALREFLKVDILYQAPRWQAAALLEAGKVYERLDQWPDAAETYQRLLSRFPGDPSATKARNRLRDAGSQSAAASGSRAKG